MAVPLVRLEDALDNLVELTLFVLKLFLVYLLSSVQLVLLHHVLDDVALVLVVLLVQVLKLSFQLSIFRFQFLCLHHPTLQLAVVDVLHVLVALFQTQELFQKPFLLFLVIGLHHRI